MCLCWVVLFVVLDLYFALKVNGCAYCVYFVLKAKWVRVGSLCMLSVDSAGVIVLLLLLLLCLQ